MGQQQLLLIVLGVIIVGIAVLIGIALFSQNSIEHKRALLINEGLTVANNARNYFSKPKTYGGGENSFLNYQIPNNFQKSPNGTYDISSVTPDKIEITGTGNDIISGNNYVKVKFIVTKDSTITEIIN